MIVTLTSVFCASFFLASTEGLINCNTGLLAGSHCEKLTECRDFQYGFKGINHAIVQLLNSRNCGFDGTIPKVCCFVSNRNIAVASKNIASRVQDHYKDSTKCGNILWNKNLSPDGHPADIDEFPWLALLQYKTPTGIKIGCGGVLLNDRYVLTAAHCLDVNLELTSVRLGEYNINTAKNCIEDGPNSVYCSGNAIEVGVEKIIPHENYSFFWGASDFSSKSYDVALIRLNNSAITDHIKPICLPMDRQTRMTDGKFLSAGWGAEPTNGFLKSNIKRMARLKRVDKQYCEQMYEKILHNDYVCALAKSNKMACIGDSGGPLMGFDKFGRMTVIGIFSPVGPGPCKKNGMPGTYTDVREYRNWIIANMHN